MEINNIKILNINLILFFKIKSIFLMFLIFYRYNLGKYYFYYQSYNKIKETLIHLCILVQEVN